MKLAPERKALISRQSSTKEFKIVEQNARLVMENLRRDIILAQINLKAFDVLKVDIHEIQQFYAGTTTRDRRLSKSLDRHIKKLGFRPLRLT